MLGAFLLPSIRMAIRKDDLGAIIDQIVEGRVSANRRFIDDVLQKIQDANHRYYLERLAIEAMRLEAEEKAGNLQAVMHHKVMVETYKALLEKTFT